MTALIGAKTHFSLGESIYSPKQLITDAAKAGYNHVFVTDSANINSLVTVTRAAKEADIKPIVGASIRVVDDINWRKPKRGEEKTKDTFWMPSVYIMNDEGYKDMARLLTLANDADHFYFVPRITLSELCDIASRGNLVVTSGIAFSAFSRTDSKTVLLALAEACENSRLIIECIPVDSSYYDKVTAKALDFAHEYDLTVSVSRPVLFPKGQSTLRTTMNCILNKDKVSSNWRNEPHDQLHVLTPNELMKEAVSQLNRLSYRGLTDITPYEAKSQIKAFFDNPREITDMFSYRWEKMEVSLPKMAVDPFGALVSIAKRGWKKRLFSPVLGYQPDAALIPQYLERLEYELGVLKKMGFENYFLLVEQLVSWCHGEKIMVGPGRGSVGGSLVAFLLNITDVDPIRFGLIFERFINPSRLDLPDVDLDFMSSRREEVIDHLVEHYGQEHVASISNYSELGSSSSLRSVGSAHELTPLDFGCSKLVPKDAGTPHELTVAMTEVPEIEKFATKFPKIWEESVGLQGTLRSYARHAAGVIVAGEPIVNRAPIEIRKGSPTVCWDKRVVEDFGLIKLDILGLSNLDILSLAKDYIKERHGIAMDYLSIDLEDEKLLEAFGNGDTAGIFQFESGGMKHLLKSLREGGKLSFSDVTAATALFRPGPIDSGLMDMYVNIKQGVEFENYLHPAMRPALESTYSVMVYQEQVMQISRDLAGFSFSDADHLRKAMGKKDPLAMAKIRDQFVEGAVSTSGVTKEAGSGLFDQIEKFAGYGFNKSHSVEYSIISMWTMYLKVHYPAEFYASALTILAEEKRLGIIKDALDKDIHVVPPDINASSDRFEIGYDDSRKQVVLYAPFQMIKGISIRGADAINIACKENGPFKSKDDFLDSVNRRLCNIRSQTSLESIGAFASIDPGSLSSRHPDRLKDQKELLPNLMVGSVKVDRDIVVAPATAKQLSKMVADCQTCDKCSLAGTPHVAPRLGSEPKIMIVTDTPNWTEAEKGLMGEGAACNSLNVALKAAGISKKNVYITSLIKAPKGKGQLTNEMIIGCGGYLEHEIELLKPPIIVTLGTKTTRHLLPEMKGKWDELVGQESYDSDKDTTLVCGFNPMMVHFDANKQETLNQLMEHVAGMLD